MGIIGPTRTITVVPDREPVTVPSEPLPQREPEPVRERETERETEKVPAG